MLNEYVLAMLVVLNGQPKMLVEVASFQQAEACVDASENMKSPVEGEVRWMAANYKQSSKQEADFGCFDRFYFEQNVGSLIQKAKY